ncbi:MAG TPA: hypothetical protein VFV72_07550 [Candidatus Limnocylindrales bacterium]|nr:hypothetical protein [Candidatus Limnocylindrales bacterium]
MDGDLRYEAIRDQIAFQHEIARLERSARITRSARARHEARDSEPTRPSGLAAVVGTTRRRLSRKPAGA